MESEGGKGNRSKAANHLHTRWRVGQAKEAYGCRPLTQLGEDILARKGKAECCHKGKQLSKEKKGQLMDFLQAKQPLVVQ